jgi:predicted flap endonuclease-1-like 5' DNA nuclease
VRAERDRLRSTLSEQGAALEARARAEELRERDQAATVAALRAQLAEQERRLSNLRELEARMDELEGQALEVASLRAANRELEARLSASPPQAEQLRESGRAPLNGRGPGDDLKRIRGIGPAFERALKARGVTTFSQIAGWSASEMEETARALRLKIERIRREDWVGGARALLEGSEKS